MEITDTKVVFVVWSNTDLTEGRGRQIPIYVCASQTTANRLSEKAGVQSTKADVYETEAYRIENKWYAPTHIRSATLADKKIDTARKSREEIVKRAKEFGLSDDDILALSNIDGDK